MTEIFLSYSRHNQEAMQRLREDLRQQGFYVWTDETGLERSSPRWQSAIEEAIERSRCLVVLLSPQAKQSEWVKMEVRYAQEFHLPILPVLIRGNGRTAVPLVLINTDWIDARRRYSRALAELVAALDRNLGRRTPKAALPTTSSPEIRRQRVAEIVEAMGGSSATGDGTVGRVHVTFGRRPLLPDLRKLYPGHQSNPIFDRILNEYPGGYRAAIAPASDLDVMEVSRRLELRGWKIEEEPSILGQASRAYVYMWPPTGGLDELLRASREPGNPKVALAEEILAANELLGLWPEDVEVDIIITHGR